MGALTFGGAVTDEAVEAPKGSGHRLVTALFTTTAFVASGLLFAVQPLVTRILLPELGGSAAAWNTAMVFFQISLLIGYLIAHVSLRRLGVRRHLLFQVAAVGVAAATLPIALPHGWVAPSEGTELWTLRALAVIVGAPFVVLSTCAPTLQRWFAATAHPLAGDPYFLYAAGNAGSLLALLSYPLLIERHLGVERQTGAWTAGFIALAALVTGCALVTRRHSARAPAADPRSMRAVRWWQPRWIAWSALPSALLLATTRHLATDVASIPLLWVVPLSLYLATFIAAFGPYRRAALRVGSAGTALCVLPASLAWVNDARLGPGPLLLHLSALTVVCLLAHARLAGDRPSATELTGFYVALAVGGAVGGVLAALIAPIAFDGIYEYPIALAAGLALLPRRQPEDHRLTVGLLAFVLLVGTTLAIDIVVGVVVTLTAVLTALVADRLPTQAAVGVAVVVLVVAIAGGDTVLRAERTFFGVSRVEQRHDGREHVLISGSTVHGSQLVVPSAERRSRTYYVEEGPVGQVFEARSSRPMDIGVIGLGAGELAVYADEDDRMTFFEIDPAVVRIATDPALFTYVPHASGDVSIEVGDGRILVERTRARYDVLILDAFSSDAIPVHLLTKEAMASYRNALAHGGVILVHVTNRYFDLEPVVGALGEAHDLDVRVNRYEGPPGAPSVWLALAERGAPLDLAKADGWRVPSRGELWTDDHADLLGALDL